MSQTVNVPQVSLADNLANVFGLSLFSMDETSEKITARYLLLTAHVAYKNRDISPAEAQHVCPLSPHFPLDIGYSSQIYAP